MPPERVLLTTDDEAHALGLLWRLRAERPQARLGVLRVGSAELGRLPVETADRWAVVEYASRTR